MGYLLGSRHFLPLWELEWTLIAALELDSLVMAILNQHKDSQSKLQTSAFGHLDFQALAWEFLITRGSREMAEREFSVLVREGRLECLKLRLLEYQCCICHKNFLTFDFHLRRTAFALESHQWLKYQLMLSGLCCHQPLHPWSVPSSFQRLSLYLEPLLVMEG